MTQAISPRFGKWLILPKLAVANQVPELTLRLVQNRKLLGASLADALTQDQFVKSVIISGNIPVGTSNQIGELSLLRDLDHVRLRQGLIQVLDQNDVVDTLGQLQKKFMLGPLKGYTGRQVYDRLKDNIRQAAMNHQLQFTQSAEENIYTLAPHGLNVPLS